METPETIGIAIDAAITALGKESEAALADLAKTSQEMGLYGDSPKGKAAIKTLEILKYEWRGGKYWKPPLGKPMERFKSSITQAIRDAAVNWPPQYLCNVECQIIDAFTCAYEHARWRPNSVMFAESVTTARTFMLLVAEALES
jgi:hypothetical protein